MEEFEKLLIAYLIPFAKVPTAVSYMSPEKYDEFIEELNAARTKVYSFVNFQIERNNNLMRRIDKLQSKYDQLYDRFGERFEAEYGFEDDDGTSD